jgi:hypothetical protein
VSVTADLQSQNINPRHESLAFYEGSVNYNYVGGKRFSCVFFNQSAVTENVRFYWRNAEGEMMPNGDFSLRLRSAAEIDAYPAVTRTGYAIDEVYRGNLWLTAEGLSGMTALYDEVVEAAPAGSSAPAPAGSGASAPAGTGSSATLGGRTAEDLLAALHASELGQRLSLPVDASVVDINKHWSIS